jgi:hypothetical protein
MSLQDLPAITVERLEGGAWGVRVEVLGVCAGDHTEAARPASFGDNSSPRRLRAAVEEARSRMASH